LQMLFVTRVRLTTCIVFHTFQEVWSAAFTSREFAQTNNPYQEGLVQKYLYRCLWCKSLPCFRCWHTKITGWWDLITLREKYYLSYI
jgi:hypothetical protein